MLTVTVTAQHLTTADQGSFTSNAIALAAKDLFPGATVVEYDDGILTLDQETWVLPGDVDDTKCGNYAFEKAESDT